MALGKLIPHFFFNIYLVGLPYVTKAHICNALILNNGNCATHTHTLLSANKSLAFSHFSFERIELGMREYAAFMSNSSDYPQFGYVRTCLIIFRPQQHCTPLDQSNMSQNPLLR